MHTAFGRGNKTLAPGLGRRGVTLKLGPLWAALGGGVARSVGIACAPLAYVIGGSNGAGSGGSAGVVDGFAFSENVVALRLGEKAGLDQV